MHSKEMREDLDYLVSKIKDVHISTFNGLSETQVNIIEGAYKKIEDDISLDDFIFIANDIMMALNDGHSRLEINLIDGDKYISVKCLWLNDGIYVIEDGDLLEKGDKIIEVSGKSLNYIFQELSKIIPHENEYIVRAKAFSMYNKMSFLLGKFLLDHLGLIKENRVNFKINRKEKIIDISSEFKDYIPSDDAEEWIEFSVDKKSDIAILKLNQCIFNEKYKYELRRFFIDVINKDIGNIVVDLRNNMGGDSRVANEFLKYIDVDNYKEYKISERVSKDTVELYMNMFNIGEEFIQSYIRTDEKENIINNEGYEDFHDRFKGNIYVVTSNTTFSSARIFATLIKDNRLGLTVGEPTGGKPTSFGNVLRFNMPNSKIKFSLSTKKFMRPNNNGHNDDSLYPDIKAYTTIEDIINRRDPQIEKIRLMSSNGRKI